jgi:cytochrome P450
VSQEVQTAVSNLKSSLRETIIERSREPRDDLISALLATREGPDPLTERELVSTSLLLLSAGFETTTNLISNGTKALVRNPEAYEQLASNLEGTPSAVEELLRYDSPVQDIVRVATKDFEVGQELWFPRAHS